MKRRTLVIISVVGLFIQITSANPIPIPIPAGMPLEEMWIDIYDESGELRADFVGDFTFDYIPFDVSSMSFPVPPDAADIAVYRDGSPLSWTWDIEMYSTILPEIPSIPMIEWYGPFPEAGAVFTVEYEHALIERGAEWIFFYALGTGKYYPTYQKTVEAIFDISLPAGMEVNGIWLDDDLVDPSNYVIDGSHLEMTLTEYFGPFTRDLIISLVPEPATFALLGVGALVLLRRLRR